MTNERLLRYALVAIAMSGLAIGLVAHLAGAPDIAHWVWAGGTAPVVVGLAVSMVRDFIDGRMGVDAVAFVAMGAALAFNEPLAGIVVAIMYSGGNVLEDRSCPRGTRPAGARRPHTSHRPSPDRECR